MPNEMHSELEVVPGSLEAGNAEKHAHYAPEHYYANDTHKVAYSPAESQKVFYDPEKIPYTNMIHEQDQPRTICGLRKKTFWIMAVVAVIVIVAAIGGGIGGALSSKKNHAGSVAAQTSSSSSSTPASTPTSASTSASTSISTSTSTPTPTTTDAITTTTVVGPSATLLRDCPSSNNTIFSVTNDGTTQLFRKACGATLVNAHGGDAMVVQPFASLNECISECAAFNIRNATEIKQGVSRRCNAVCWRNDVQKRDRWPGGQCLGWTTQNATTGGFNFQVTTDPKVPVTICDSAALIN